MVTDGDFNNFEGTVISVNGEEARVNVKIFGGCEPQTIAVKDLQKESGPAPCPATE